MRIRGWWSRKRLTLRFLLDKIEEVGFVILTNRNNSLANEKESSTNE